MRYVVDPKKRRQASIFIFAEVFEQAHARGDITIASQTMDVAVQMRAGQPESELSAI